MSFLQSAPGDDPVILEGLFDAPVEDVYRAWTEPTEFATWFTLVDGKSGTAELSVEVGGVWRFHLPDGMAWFEGRYTQVEDCRTLAFTWRHVRLENGGRSETPESRVTVRFEPRGSQTQLHLRHEGASEVGRGSIGTGWTGAFERLKEKVT
ncbi:MAG: SRPBCC domain-containing protein [Pseudomonadota bacterium]